MSCNINSLSTFYNISIFISIESDEESDIEELLKTTDTYLTNKSGTLSSGFLHIKRVTDANKERRSKVYIVKNKKI